MNATKNDIAFYGNLIMSSTSSGWTAWVFLALAIFALYRSFNELPTR